MKYIEEILPCLLTMLDFNDKKIKVNTCWALSNITNGPMIGPNRQNSIDRIQYVLDVSKKVTV